MSTYKKTTVTLTFIHTDEIPNEYTLAQIVEAADPDSLDQCWHMGTDEISEQAAYAFLKDGEYEMLEFQPLPEQ